MQTRISRVLHLSREQRLEYRACENREEKKSEKIVKKKKRIYTEKRNET